MTKKEKRRQYTFVIKELVSREIKKKICKILSWNCMECIESIIVNDRDHTNFLTYVPSCD